MPPPSRSSSRLLQRLSALDSNTARLCLDTLSSCCRLRSATSVLPARRHTSAQTGRHVFSFQLQAHRPSTCRQAGIYQTSASFSLYTRLTSNTTQIRSRTFPEKHPKPAIIPPTVTMEPIVHTVFEPQTSTWQYVVADPSTKTAVIIDPVLDFDPARNSITTKSADALLALVKEKGYTVDRLLETHVHADHLTA